MTRTIQVKSAHPLRQASDGVTTRTRTAQKLPAPRGPDTSARTPFPRCAVGRAWPQDAERTTAERRYAARSCSSAGSIPGGPRISMPCSAAMRASSTGRAARPAARCCPRRGRSASKPAGVEVTSQRASRSPTRRVCGTPRGARMLSPARRTCCSSPDPQRELALEDVEALVVGVVDVQRGVVAGRAGRLEQREGAVGLRGGDVDVDAVAQEPDVGHERGASGAVGKL